MTTRNRSARPLFAVAALSLILAVVTGVGWLGTPFRLVQLVTIIGLGMAVGASWAQAVWRLREQRRRDATVEEKR